MHLSARGHTVTVDNTTLPREPVTLRTTQIVILYFIFLYRYKFTQKNEVENLSFQYMFIHN